MEWPCSPGSQNQR
ncbi:hypothetical protein EYZ11_009212 [Aspergillus tanneri]|uniref:Uncharacterized protein n=1 Tax=Aspergillus tanneri TaxID=1220188 RepID=A0A4S3J8L4_9EURO|nr:hypothetical protein EYZ11_009212 [Aspergillus tanneri]